MGMVDLSVLVEEGEPRATPGADHPDVTVRSSGAGGRHKSDRVSEVVTTWGSMTSQVLALREHLVAERVTCVVMEATSDYWKPYYYLLEDLPGCEVMLVNARHVKNLPGRKSDVNDATWLADPTVMQSGANAAIGRTRGSAASHRSARVSSTMPTVPCFAHRRARSWRSSSPMNRPVGL